MTRSTSAVECGDTTNLHSLLAAGTEAAGLDADGKTWHVGGPGNGEQCSWWCWGMAKVRKAAGLSAAPK